MEKTKHFKRGERMVNPTFDATTQEAVKELLAGSPKN
jgi:hypothetical protein